jgi:N-acetylneuraminic acid mutarotase
LHCSNHCELQDAREAGEDDIEKILAEIMAKDAQKTAVSVTVCSAPPTPRANFTMTSLPSGDLVMFGGEYFDGEDTTCYNDLYRWSVEKGEWRLIESPNSPPPRCSHQAVYYRDHIYIFGGEFATTEQFYHYK